MAQSYRHRQNKAASDFGPWGSPYFFMFSCCFGANLYHLRKTKPAETWRKPKKTFSYAYLIDFVKLGIPLIRDYGLSYFFPRVGTVKIRALVNWCLFPTFCKTNPKPSIETSYKTVVSDYYFFCYLKR